jgi:hypothetical protein
MGSRIEAVAFWVLILCATVAGALWAASPAIQALIGTEAPPTYADEYDLLVEISSGSVLVREAISGDGERGWGDDLWRADGRVLVACYLNGSWQVCPLECEVVEVIFDSNRDGDIDLEDFAVFQCVFMGPT